MKIIEAEAYICHFPLKEPFHPSWIPGLPMHNNSAVILRLLTDEDIEGVCAGMAFAQEWKGAPELIKLFLIGRDPFQVEDFVQVLRSAKVIGFRPWFVEIAFWDIIGKAAGQPIHRLLGGARDRVKAYASTGELRDPETRARDALRLVEEGFRGIKLRLRNEDVRRDLAVVEAVRIAVGDEVEIMVPTFPTFHRAF